MIKVAAFTSKSSDPSTRFRVLQYMSYLKNLDIDIEVLNTSIGRYPNSTTITSRIWWGIQNILENVPNVIKSYKYDVTFLQREMLSTLYTLEGLTKSPRILDVDDAIFTRRNGIAARKLAQNVDHVICGNSYLANWFSQYNENISIIPTGVDTVRFSPIRKKTILSDKVIIVWSGSSSGYKFFEQSGLLNALNHLLKLGSLTLRIISDKPPPFLLSNTEFIQWSVENEVKYMNECDIGLMPLTDDEFARGKCSYKMLTYMSCALPVIVSPVGMNNDVLALGNLGFAAKNSEDWFDKINYLVNNYEERVFMGLVGRQVIEQNFSLLKVVEQIKSVIVKVI